ncbi:Nitro_FeMo-Co domain-containing protein [Candidatus Hydrogenisulfobacillus filiaventi]|uniref:Nitro_FeMo-Co domain-containing protein n=1 Tax=Candidatus Hydrogenisulfobacillus filiaventi TaxID=2707344 RepID=A0A6F8ZDY8_9FIRM|nr:hypothetical protein [Bacillota bacterium]CAB1127904.1 Nitro_FeMo-Co domain-containing protein [Candidatus Hydrogenisulfobacillus filiaventi]
MAIRICVPVNPDGTIDPRWGRAARVALVDVEPAAEAEGEPRITGWNEVAVGWDVLHDQSVEGEHHARVARFLMENQVTHVLAYTMGGGMAHMLQRMHLGLGMGAMGDARAAVREFAGRIQAQEQQ